MSEVFLYYWDERDGSNWRGWWIAPAPIGGDHFFAFAKGSEASPELCTNWSPHAPNVVSVAKLEDGSMGVRGPGLCFEGVYEYEPSHPHQHDDRPVFRRTRELAASEVELLDHLRAAAADVVIFSGGMSLEDASRLRDAAQATAISGDGTTQSVLDWVRGGDVDAVPGLGWAYQGDERSAPVPVGTADASAAHQPAVLLRTVRVQDAIDLEQEVAKAAAEWLSVPSLHDEESPPPVGWVLAERSHATISRSVREHVLTAAAHLEEELPPEIRALPQVQEQAARLRRLVEGGGAFEVCVWGGQPADGAKEGT